MFNINFDLAALNSQLQARINVIHAPSLMAYVGRRMAAKMEEVVPEYPPQSNAPRPKIYQRRRKDGTPYMSAFKSAKQQGKVFLLIKQNKVPTRRTGTLGRSITTGVQALPDSVTVEIGTNIKYAPYVIGDNDEQSSYHALNWWQLNHVIAVYMPEINAEAQKALTTGVQRLINGESL